MEQVIVSKKVNDLLENLIDIVLDEEYFNSLEDAVKYVHDITTFIYSIPTKRYRVAPNKVNGNFDTMYKANKIQLGILLLIWKMIYISFKILPIIIQQIIRVL
jgi:hypothetical protein